MISCALSFVVEHVSGITCFDSRLYLICPDRHTIQVFRADTLSEVSVITVSGLRNPKNIVACRDDKQLYVIDIMNSIWRVSAEDPNDYDEWLTDYALRGYCSLSVKSRRLLVTSQQPHSLRQYFTLNRQLLRAIDLPDSLKELTHAVETSRGTFVVCHVKPSAVSEFIATTSRLSVFDVEAPGCMFVYFKQSRKFIGLESAHFSALTPVI